MSGKIIKVEIREESNERFLLTIYADGREERMPIVASAKKKRDSSRPYWYWELKSGQRNFF